MRNFLLLVLGSFYGIGFCQYIEEASLKFKELDEVFSVKDVVFLNDKTIQFRDVSQPYVLSSTKIKKLEKFTFDSVHYHKEVPKLSETFTYKREGKGVYLTIDDVFNDVLNERYFRAKKIGYIYEFPADLLDVIDGKTNKRIKDVAGLVYHGDLYLSIKNIWGNESEENNNYVLMNEKNTFVRVKYIHKDFLYFEMPLRGMGSFILSTSLGMFGAIGGLATSLVTVRTPEYYRPIILYKNEHEISIIKNCKQFNEHFKKKNQETNINCENDDYNLNNIRKSILNIGEL